jgi:hypothetical protein
MNEKISEILNREMDLLSQEKIQTNLAIDMKKKVFADNIKNNLGKNIKQKIDNPDRHNPKNLSFWEKFKKAIGC